MRFISIGGWVPVLVDEFYVHEAAMHRLSNTVRRHACHHEPLSGERRHYVDRATFSSLFLCRGVDFKEVIRGTLRGRSVRAREASIQYAGKTRVG